MLEENVGYHYQISKVTLDLRLTYGETDMLHVLT